MLYWEVPRFAVIGRIGLGQEGDKAASDSTTQYVPSDFTEQHLNGLGSHKINFYVGGLRKSLWRVTLVRQDDGEFMLGDGWTEFVERVTPAGVRWLLIAFKYEGNRNYIVGAYMPTGDPVDLVTELCPISPALRAPIDFQPSFAVQFTTSTETDFSQVLPPIAREWHRQTNYDYVNLKLEGCSKKHSYVQFKSDVVSISFSTGWRSFVREHHLYKWSLAVFQFTNSRDVIVNLYDIPTPPYSSDLVGPSSNTIDISSDSNHATTDSEDDTYPSTDSEDMEIYEEDEEETAESVTRDYFCCNVQKNTAQPPTDWAKWHLDCRGKWVSTLIFWPSEVRMEVRVVKSNNTVKFSAGFTLFMKKNGIVWGDRLMFRLVGKQTFVVQRIS